MEVPQMVVKVAILTGFGINCDETAAVLIWW